MGNTSSLGIMGTNEISVKYGTRRASVKELPEIMRRYSEERGVLDAEALQESVQSGVLVKSFCDIEIESSSSGKHSRTSSLSVSRQGSFSRRLKTRIHEAIPEPEPVAISHLETSGSIRRPKPCIQEDPEPEPVSIILPEPKKEKKKRTRVTLMTFNPLSTVYDPKRHIFNRLGRANSCTPDIPSQVEKRDPPRPKVPAKTIVVPKKDRSKRTSILTSKFYSSRINTS